MDQSYANPTQVIPVAAIDVDARARFIIRTYTHLFGAILGFILLEFLLFTSGVAETMARAMLSVNWLFILGGFVLVSWLASHAAHRSTSLGMQYLALCGFVVAQAIIFVPLLYVADSYAPGAISSAAMVTLLAFAALTGIAFWTRKDFSFLGGILRWAFVLAIVAIVAGAIFGFQLGTWFSVAMVGLAGGYILYYTSNVLHHYRTDQHVAASLALFAAVALMFYYIVRLFMNRN